MIKDANSDVGKAVTFRLVSEGIKVYAADACVEELLHLQQKGVTLLKMS